jgi:hypothetical protein
MIDVNFVLRSANVSLISLSLNLVPPVAALVRPLALRLTKIIKLAAP